MINRIWGLIQNTLQVNGHVRFHLLGLRWAVRNGKQAKNSKWESNQRPLVLQLGTLDRLAAGTDGVFFAFKLFQNPWQYIYQIDYGFVC